MVARTARLILVGALVIAGCGTVPVADAPASSDTVHGAPRADSGRAVAGTARLLFAGDAMLGRSVAVIARDDPEGLFRDVRRVIRAADVAAVNVESPLTLRPHISANPHRLEAHPATARLLADAGFDIGSVANNHAGDAGPASVLDSVEALDGAGMLAVGGGANAADAHRARTIEVHGLHVAFLAFDVSGSGLTATEGRPGIATWDAATAETTVADARAANDIVVVSIHGGVADRESVDPLLAPVAERLASWGTDVVWGHGPHVEQPIVVLDPDGDDRPTVVATSLSVRCGASDISGSVETASSIGTLTQSCSLMWPCW